MTDATKDHIDGYATQGIGGWAEYSAWATPVDDPISHHKVVAPSMKVIPIVFLPGIMGSNLRMSKARQKELNLPDNRAWRPDDIGKWDALTSNDYAGRVRQATPTQRQKTFDPNTTEVEHYSYTSDKDMFDPEGTETLRSDARHSNIPNKFADIPPLLTSGPPAPKDAPWHIKSRKIETAAQKARWRGWSEVLIDGAYGSILQTLESKLNNLFAHLGSAQLQVNPFNWQGQLHTQSPHAFGGSSGEPIKREQIEALNVHGRGPLWFPVHAMGYNWLKSNADSAKVLAERITGLIDGYKKRGFQCEKVIVVTHSMGGLAARALIHPNYGNLQDKVLGIYHSAMPTHGAGAAYKRIRCGFENVGIGGSIAQQILGATGKHVTAVMANSPGSLELLPNDAYGKEWLKVVDHNGQVLARWPGADSLSAQDKAAYTNPQPQYQPLRNQVARETWFVDDTNAFQVYADKLKQQMTSVNAIYTQSNDRWWRLFNPDWVNPAKVKEQDGGGIDKTIDRVQAAADFHKAIAKTFHPVSYASYCASPSQKSYGEVVWQLDGSGEGSLPLRPEDRNPATWQLISEDGKGRVVVRTPTGRQLTLIMQAPQQDGDGTVPAERSAQHVQGMPFVHGRGQDKAHYDHQDSYADKEVQASALWSMVQMANITIRQQWWKKKT